MSSLLAIVLVTQADQSSPSLVFAWPPCPKPTLRLDRPVYKSEQCDDAFYFGKRSHPASHHPQPHPDYDNHHQFHFVRGFDSPHNKQSSSDDTPRFGPSSYDVQEEDSALPRLFYPNHDSLRLNTQESTPSTSYLCFEPDAWADMLTPRVHGSHSLNTPGNMNSGRKLELVIDALAIIAHPVLVNQKTTGFNGDHCMERGRTRTRSVEHVIPTDTSNPLPTAFLSSTASPNLTEPSGQNSDQPNEEPDLSTLDLNENPTSSSSPVKPSAPISQLTKMLTPSTKPMDQSSAGTQTLLQPQSSASIRSHSSPSPVALPPRFKIQPRYDPITYSPMGDFPLTPTVKVDGEQVHNTTSFPSTQLAPLQSFTLALIIDTPPASHLSQHLEVYYKDVVLKFTAALKHLERKISYLTQEVQDIMRKLSGRRNSDSSISQSKPLGIEEKMKFLAENCDLPRALARAFSDLKTLGSTSITLAQQLDLDLLLHHELLDSNTIPDNWLAANRFKSPSLQAGDQDQFTHLESWKSILLLEDPQILMEQTAPGSLLSDFIAIIKPALTLSEYKFLLDTDSNTIADMTDHLLYWRKAKITDMITLRNSYQLTFPVNSSSSSNNLLPISTLQHEFSIAFPDLPNLVMILSLISQCSRQPFLNLLPNLNPNLDKSESMSVLVWLLKRDLLVRERTHVRIKIDRYTKLKVVLWEQQRKHNHKGSDDDNDGVDEQRSLSPESQPRNEANKHRPINSSLSSSHPLRFNSNSSSLNKTARDIQIQQQPIMSDQTFNSNAKPSSFSHGANQLTTDYRGAQSLQPRSINSIISSDGIDRDGSRKRQQSVQSDFSDLSERNKNHHHNTEFEGTTINGNVSSTHQKFDLVDSIIGEPGQATAGEQRWLDEICSDKSDSQIRSFNS